MLRFVDLLRALLNKTAPHNYKTVVKLYVVGMVKWAYSLE